MYETYPPSRSINFEYTFTLAFSASLKKNKENINTKQKRLKETNYA
ncbi:hypothetical protein PI23P_01547 [Polaribacter irgensii 23-P]|uniref:Uncharacterized protein n=1 Tax=Polaribacter irgensii 23-P TaxID=313594 RepID=A4BVZ6_9FLAO|nr:hypothetical protein PI23P_01547 [Polaribacter irgensii 23-P]